MKKSGESIINIAFIGLYPEYTNQIASLVAEQLEMYFLDSLALFEFEMSPCSLANFLKQNGITYFREKEKSFVRYVCSFKNTIITFQSGVLLNPEKIKSISEHGLVVYIHHEMNKIKKYQETKTYASNEIKKLFCLKDSEICRRVDLAKKHADIVVNGSKIGAFKCMAEVIRQIKKYYSVQEG